MAETVVARERPAGKVEAPAAGLTIHTKGSLLMSTATETNTTTRRAALLGLAAAVPATAAIAPAVAGEHPDAELIRLGAEMDRFSPRPPR